MRIINFNNTNTWTAWKKAYIDDLNIKITSLWNHLIYQNPPYVILNSVASENLINLDESGYRIRVSSNNGSVNIFFPAHLQLHQGFYNDSNYGDALLGYYDNEGYICPMTNGTFVRFKPAESVESTNIPVEKYDFLSGYCCVASVLPSGENSPYNEKKWDIENYLVYPLGNGAFFTLQTHQSNLLAKYRRNDMQGFVNKIIINLCSALRYYIHNHDNQISSGIWSCLNCSLGTYYIADHDNNLWTGGEDIIPEIYNKSHELVICDSSYQIQEQPDNQILCYRLLVNTNIKIANYARVELY